MKKSFDATSVRSSLTVLVVLLILGASAGFYFAIQQIRTYAVEVSHSVVDSEASGDQVSELQVLKQELENRESLVNKANKLFATNDTYQSQALKDVQKYAQTYGITIVNTSFDSDISSMNSHVFVTTIQSPVSYDKLLQFLDAIEGNLPKMQITSVSLGHSTSGSSGNVTAEAIKIGISTR